MSGRSLRAALTAVLLLGASFLLLAGCDALLTPTQPSATALPTPPVPTSTSAPQVSTPTIEDSGLIPIIIWLPPQFDPELGTSASELLKARLEAFNLEHPNLAVSYRIKNETGPAGLLDSLSSTSKVAPQALPDLILFPDSELQNAIERSLVYPYPAPIPSSEDTDWFTVAASLSSYQGQTYSQPLAADGLTLVYNAEIIENVPRTWEELVSAGYLLSFPPADPQAAFTLALYLSQGATLREPESGITLQAEELQKVLDLYLQIQNQNRLPSNPTQIDTDRGAWERFLFGARQTVITKASRYLAQKEEGLLAVPLPTEDGGSFTLVNGWGWALTNPDPNKQVAAEELARYLSTAEFAGAWTDAADLLPLRPKALEFWENETDQIIATQLLTNAQPMPPVSVTAVVSPLMRDAAISVLSGEQTPEEAAQSAAEFLQN